MMAANSPPRTAPADRPRPVLWLAVPAGRGNLPRRAAGADRAMRAALLRHLERQGLAAAPGPGLSHAGGYACYLSNPAVQTGLDLEWIRRRDVVSLANFAYAPEEAHRLAALPGEERDAAFVELWVLKEAAAKALGLDLFTALASCVFSVQGGVISGAVPGGVPWRAARTSLLRMAADPRSCARGRLAQDRDRRGRHRCRARRSGRSRIFSVGPAMRMMRRALPAVGRGPLSGIIAGRQRGARTCC